MALTMLRSKAVRPAAASRTRSVKVAAAGRPLWLPDAQAPKRELHGVSAEFAMRLEAPRPDIGNLLLPARRPERHSAGEQSGSWIAGRFSRGSRCSRAADSD